MWPSGNRRFGWFGPQNHRASRFPCLGLKTRGTSGTGGLWRQRTHDAIAKLLSRRSKVVKEACPFDASTKSWTVLPLRACIVVIRVGVFMSFAEDLI